ncbi:hypothetical protein SKAU_G00184960 [Synaphobranchus kaupii]|uniref:Uncharacterized protein n=1 Tax=Synaphobranchus kaupii TaxID=118154 RepID=A0A9Q1IUL2_SYNKA|nr:hypothetical protein SKAU_G00184960 [Synaphobranchus kaupii]
MPEKLGGALSASASTIASAAPPRGLGQAKQPPARISRANHSFAEGEGGQQSRRITEGNQNEARQLSAAAVAMANAPAAVKTGFQRKGLWKRKTPQLVLKGDLDRGGLPEALDRAGHLSSVIHTVAPDREVTGGHGLGPGPGRRAMSGCDVYPSSRTFSPRGKSRTPRTLLPPPGVVKRPGASDAKVTTYLRYSCFIIHSETVAGMPLHGRAPVGSLPRRCPTE